MYGMASRPPSDEDEYRSLRSLPLPRQNSFNSSNAFNNNNNNNLTLPSIQEGFDNFGDVRGSNRGPSREGFQNPASILADDRSINASSRLSQNHQEQPPPSNQQTRRAPQLTENIQDISPDRFGDFSDFADYFDDVELDLFDFDNFDLESIPGFHSYNNDPTPDLFTPTATGTRRSSVVDLTGSQPSTMPSRPAKRKAEDESSHTSSRPTKRSLCSRDASRPPAHEDAELVDLVDVEGKEQYEHFRQQQLAEATKKQAKEEADRPVKLAAFQCIICMDSPTDLVVTHCGHMFCSECLHQALHAGAGRKSCPVCRTVINTSMMGKEQKRQPRNGVFALEMKLMTANKKGKQVARAQ